MRFSRLWFSVRRLLVAVVTVMCLVAIHWLIVNYHVNASVYVAVSSCVAGLFVLGAMRKPWFFLGIAVLLWAALPTVFDSSANDLFVGSYSLGWLLGAFAGGIIRSVRRIVASRPLDPKPPEPN
jgi:hypothetical protein